MPLCCWYPRGGNSVSSLRKAKDQPSGWRRLYRTLVPYGVRNFVRQGIILAPHHARRLVNHGMHAMTGTTGVLPSLFDERTRGLLPDGSIHPDVMAGLIRKSG